MRTNACTWPSPWMRLGARWRSGAARIALRVGRGLPVLADYSIRLRPDGVIGQDRRLRLRQSRAPLRYRPARHGHGRARPALLHLLYGADRRGIIRAGGVRGWPT